MLDWLAMNKLEVDIAHRLSRDEARSRIDRVTEKLARDFSAECNWDGGSRLVVKICAGCAICCCIQICSFSTVAISINIGNVITGNTQ